MTLMILRHELTKIWLAQFKEHDRGVAEKLLASVRFVSDNEFRSGLNSILEERIDAGLLPVALYNEAELPPPKGTPYPLFIEEGQNTRRAVGEFGPALVPDQRNMYRACRKTRIRSSRLRTNQENQVNICHLFTLYRCFWNAVCLTRSAQSSYPTSPYQEVGSEGIVANVITQLHRSRRPQLWPSPGPDIIRQERIKRFMLVTDFIGSGNRTCRFLDAAWRVRSVRSWWSRRASAGWSFEVVAYAGLPSGIARIEGHPCQPLVKVAMTAPTIRSIYMPDEARVLEELCRRYSIGVSNPLGYNDCAALIAFAHSMPNNAPALFWEPAKGWRPLFPERSTTGTATPFEAGLDPASNLERLKMITGLTFSSESEAPDLIEMLVLSTLANSARNSEAISGRLGMRIEKINDALENLHGRELISKEYQITKRGSIILQRFVGFGESKPLPPPEPSLYYPKMLRAPRDV